MPTLARLSGCAITLYAGDHLPPHFHVRTKDSKEALIVIHTLAVLSGALAQRELTEALAWAQGNRAVLLQKWQELNP